MERKADDLCPVYRDKTEFLDALAQKTKVAMHMGQIAKEKIRYAPTEQAMKDIMNNRRTYDQLESPDFEIVGMKQTGVDMKIGLDVAKLAQSRIVDQIILIADDSSPFQKPARPKTLKLGWLRYATEQQVRTGICATCPSRFIPLQNVPRRLVRTGIRTGLVMCGLVH